MSMFSKQLVGYRVSPAATDAPVARPRRSKLATYGIASGVIVASGVIGAQVAGAIVATSVGAHALSAAYALAGAGGDALVVGAADVAVAGVLWPAIRRLRGGWTRTRNAVA
jgi:hypothetical protein